MHLPHHFFPLRGAVFKMYRVYLYLKLVFSSLTKKYSGAFIILSEASPASYSHFTECDVFVFNQTSKGDNNIIGHFLFIYFFHKSDICYVQLSTGFMLLYINNKLFCN